MTEKTTQHWLAVIKDLNQDQTAKLIYCLVRESFKAGYAMCISDIEKDLDFKKQLLKSEG